ncbi:TetR family transcriptional regulator [Bordetella ansorpii]|uniref:TetR family transcriptional regulator n=1 Tax=Bordetella ansorpii TaxID=288768 RepID=A0A157Q1M0_9BORD|nr:TetR/AcrR family transcriptional regulator [Bordetella ansorpii]SAI39775.1 TetR family transcriptional regulator [Bordetella ansorpii]
MTFSPDAKRPRTKPAETRRGELMDAALALFLDKGFDGASVDEIVNRADVAKGTFYLYFKTKDDVLQALRERFVEQFLACLEDAVAGCAADDWAGRLDAWIEAGIALYLKEFALHDLVFHEFRPSHRHARNDNVVIAHLARLIEGGVRAGAWRSRNPRQTAAMVFSAVHGAVDEEIISATRMGKEALTREVLTFCRSAVGLPLRV